MPTQNTNFIPEFFVKFYEIIKNNQFDPAFIYQWHLMDSKTVDAWQAFGMGSTDIVVAVIDTDFDIMHSDIVNKLHHPKDFYIGAVPSVTVPFQFYQGSEHGTACATLVAAAQDGKGVVGVAPNVKIMPIRPVFFSGEDPDDLWIAAFEYAVANGAHIVSCSLGYKSFGGLQEDDNPLSDKIVAALNRLGNEAIFCFATGNAAKLALGFSTHPRVLGISACSVHNKITDYANYNTNSTIVTASDSDGLRITTGDLSGKRGKSEDDVTHDFGGTSAACPIVAGVIALMLSQNRNLKIDDVKDILCQTGMPIKEPNQDKTVYKINALEAVRAAKALISTTPVYPLAGVIHVTEANVRSIPNLFGVILRKLKKDDRVTILAEKDGWYKIGQSQYVNRKLIQIV